MADNPRLPDHHSDFPSSRPSGGTPNPASPSTGSGYNPPPSQQRSVSPTKTHLRNVLIGSIVTIFTSTIVFLITQTLKKPEGNDTLIKKEATTRAWKSYVAYENSYTENLLSFEKEFFKTGVDPYLAGVKKESEKFQKIMKDLAKTKNLDKDLINILNRRMENEKDYIPKHEEHFLIEKKLLRATKAAKRKYKRF